MIVDEPIDNEYIDLKVRIDNVEADLLELGRQMANDSTLSERQRELAAKVYADHLESISERNKS